jgi:magnesium-transporting ATPase (P-type)
MQNIQFGVPNSFYVSNEVHQLNYPLLHVPYLTIKKYFFSNGKPNYENLYFLVLAIFQLLTLGLIPKEWSPTGPFSTAVPLILCILLEIITNMYQWYRYWKMDYENNAKVINTIFDRGIIKNSELMVGDVIKLNKNDVVPADGILVDCGKDKYGKISLSPLNGEANIQYINKIGHHNYNNILKHLLNSNAELRITNYYPNNFCNFEGSIIISDNNYQDDNYTDNISVNGNSFIVSDSIVKSDELTIWVTRCGHDRKSHIKNTNNNNDNIKQSSLDSHVKYYMSNVNTYLLFVLILILSFAKIYGNNTNFNILNLFFLCIQNWILLNGIIPFSVKIFLILVRNAQTYYLNNNHHNYNHNNNYHSIKCNTSLLIDEVGKINTIITDKTGTLTKNELEFTTILQLNSNDIIDIESNNSNININVDLIKCLGICIHQTEEDFSTVEDKTIRYRYEFLNSRITQNGQHIKLTIDNTKYRYEYVEIAGLDFTYDRKMSSKIVKDNNGNHFMFSKGSIDTIMKKITSPGELLRLDQLISSNKPELRLLACAFRQIDQFELIQHLADSANNTMFVESLENNLQLLGIIGIRDNLQDGVKNCITRLSDVGINTSMCTGDRKITALAIGQECGIITNYESMIDYNLDIMNNINNINTENKTLLFNSRILHEIMQKQNKILLEKFKSDLALSKNFIAYNSVPEDKKHLVEIVRDKDNNNSKSKVMTCGDGFNDISMFKSSNVSVAIKGNSFVENSADFVVTEFKDIADLVFKIGPSHSNKNCFLANYTFYRCVIVVFALVIYNLIKYNEPTVSIFDGFVIQAFNFAWCMLPIIYDVVNNNVNINNINTNTINTNLWMISGLSLSFIITVITYIRVAEEYFNNILAFVIIIVLNVTSLLFIDINLNSVLLCFVGPMLYKFYSYCFL